MDENQIQKKETLPKITQLSKQQSQTEVLHLQLQVRVPSVFIFSALFSTF